MLGFRSIIHSSTAETARTNMLNMHLGRSKGANYSSQKAFDVEAGMAEMNI